MGVIKFLSDLWEGVLIDYYYRRDMFSRWFGKKKYAVKLWWAKKRGTIVYYRHYSMDCDLVSREGVAYALNKKMFEKHEQEMWENAEGPCSMTVISEAEYESESYLGDYVRDHITEAWEDGRGRNIIV